MKLKEDSCQPFKKVFKSEYVAEKQRGVESPFAFYLSLHPHFPLDEE